MLTTTYKAWFDRLTDPAGRLLVRLGVSPNTLTILGVLLGLGACLYLLVTRNITVFIFLCLACGLFDSLDGAVARLGERSSKFGAYLDAMADRYFDSMVYVAVAAVTGYWFWSMVTLAGGLITSYAKARASLEVTVTNTEWPDLLERTERGLIYLLGLGLSQWWPIRPGGHDLFYWTLVGLAVGTHATVLQRVLRAKRLIQARSR